MSSSPNQVARGCEIVMHLDVKFHGESKNAIRSWKILTFGGVMGKIPFSDLSEPIYASLGLKESDLSDRVSRPKRCAVKSTS